MKKKEIFVIFIAVFLNLLLGLTNEITEHSIFYVCLVIDLCMGCLGIWLSDTENRKRNRWSLIIIGISAFLLTYFNLVLDLSHGSQSIKGFVCFQMGILFALWQNPNSDIKRVIKKIESRYTFVTVYLCVHLLLMLARALELVITEYLIIVLAFVLLLWMKYEYEKNDRFSTSVILLLQSTIVYFMLNISNGLSGVNGIFWGIIPIIAIMIFLRNILGGNSLNAMKLGFCILVIWSIINLFVVKFRGTPILPVDIYSAQTALNVLDGYKFSFDMNLLAILVCGGILLYSVKMVRLIKCEKVKGRGEICFILSAVLALVVFYSDIWYKDISGNEWKTMDVIDAKGYFLTFFANAKSEIASAPDEYSLEKIEEIVLNNDVKKENKNQNLIQPDIIVIMNETFSDLRVVGDFETSEELMPFIDSLQGDNVKKGDLVTRKGAGTSTTESEFLLSTSEENFFGSVPYVRNIKQEIPSLVSVLEEQGYSTLAFHPADMGNYNRSTVYQYIGFDEVYFRDDITGEIELYNNYVSDKADYRLLIDMYEQMKEQDVEKPIFAFNVTIQNHSPYDTVEETIVINSFEAESDVETYLACIRESDEAFKELISYFSNVNRPTIILMFGDHQPRINDSFYENLLAKSMNNFDEYESMKTIITPYILWANYNINSEDIDIMSANYLAPYLLQTVGLEMNGYQEFVWKMHEEVPVMQKGIYMDKEGNIYSYDMESEYTEWFKQYKLLAYNYIFDSENRVEEFWRVGEENSHTYVGREK